MIQSVLLLLHPGVEEIEAVTPLDLLRRARFKVTTASTDPSLHVRGRSGLTLIADEKLADLDWNHFNALIIPGGPGIQKLRQQKPLIEKIAAFHAAGKPIGAICAAPLLLHLAGISKRHALTGHPSIAEEIPAILNQPTTLADGIVITSAGAGTAVDFSLRLIEEWGDAERAREVAQSIVAHTAGGSGS